MTKKSMMIFGQWGLGDNIYARPFIKKMCEFWNIYLDTPWPEIYEDLSVKFVMPKPRNLRTQTRNVQRQPPNRWTPLPKLWMDNKHISYFDFGIRNLSIPKAIELKFGVPVDWSLWDLPSRLEHSPVFTLLPVAVIKATTIREEWKSGSRNPKPEYVNWIATQLMKTHFVVVVGDIDGHAEKLVGDSTPCHKAFIKGELPIEKLIALVRYADIIVGGVGWNVPMSIALKTKSFVILGGRGAHNAPDIITDPNMDLSRIGFAIPRNYCRCSNAQHDCNKDIPDLVEQWENYCNKFHLIKPPILHGGQLELATIQ